MEQKNVSEIRIYEDFKVGCGCSAHIRIMADITYSANGLLVVPTTIQRDV